ncbi:hypothetical protein F0562_023086 [Nyssa sinensis]|uniref:Uncharacterized protein n=1 Tax=Nyssa sinensis TaxID=561372 RepID=A0A5J5BGY8_9ASTE|nr:hypothetical protein F0562_023086 [Nyssa sinensis]
MAFIIFCGPFSDMAATATAMEVPKFRSPASERRLPNATEKAMGPTRVAVGVPNTWFKRCVLVRASERQREEVNSSINDADRAFTSPEDLNYLWKLGAGSVVFAAAIKYGSILFPEITRPNILQALIMISAPVTVAVLLLIKQSREE